MHATDGEVNDTLLVGDGMWRQTMMMMTKHCRIITTTQTANDLVVMTIQVKESIIALTLFTSSISLDNDDDDNYDDDDSDNGVVMMMMMMMICSDDDDDL
jgi:hypothetical protein